MPRAQLCQMRRSKELQMLLQQPIQHPQPISNPRQGTQGTASIRCVFCPVMSAAWPATMLIMVLSLSTPWLHVALPACCSLYMQDGHISFAPA